MECEQNWSANSTHNSTVNKTSSKNETKFYLVGFSNVIIKFNSAPLIHINLADQKSGNWKYPRLSFA